MNTVIEKLTSTSNKKLESWYDKDLQFGISIGEYCKVCHEEIPLEQGGYHGKPTLCLMCKITEAREEQLTKLGI